MATMNKNNQLEEALANLNKIKPEQLDSLIKEAIETFDSLQDKIGSQNPEDAKKALEATMTLKESLETQMHALLANAGIDPEKLKESMADLSFFAPEDQAIAKQIKQEIEKFVPRQESSPKKKRRSKAEWIPG